MNGFHPTTRVVVIAAIGLSLVLSMGSVSAISTLGVTNDGNLEFSGNQFDKGISFIAFCSGDDVNESDVVDITGHNFDSDGNPRTVTWETAVGVEAAVVKGGDGFAINNYTPPAFNDTVPNTDTDTGYDAEAQDPCPDGMSGVKFEFDGDVFEEV